MTPIEQDLSAALAEARELLQSYGDKWLAGRLSELEDRLKRGDHSAISSALSEATGSMGSLQDRILSPSNGDPIEASEAQAVNARLTKLVKTIELRARAALGLRHLHPRR